MERKSKDSKELKVSIVKRYIYGEGLTYSLAAQVNTAGKVVDDWIK